MDYTGKTRLFHLRDELRNPVATVATLSMANDRVLWTMAIINPNPTKKGTKDVWSRSFVAKLLANRLAKGRKNVYETTYSKHMKRDIIKQIAATTIRPQVKNAALLWLLHDHHRQGTRPTNVKPISG